jgi:hypothetical protein
VSFAVDCLLPDGSSFEGQAKDMSVGGMFVEGTQPVPFGTELTLVVKGQAARELRLPGVVRWFEGRGFGVQFGLLGAYATHALVDLVKKHSL